MNNSNIKLDIFTKVYQIKDEYGLQDITLGELDKEIQQKIIEDQIKAKLYDELKAKSALYCPICNFEYGNPDDSGNWFPTISELHKENQQLIEDNRQLKFRLADEQDCNQHGECHAKIKQLEEQNEGLEAEVDIFEKEQKTLQHVNSCKYCQNEGTKNCNKFKLIINGGA